jgi:hypothetical protein
MYGMFEQFQAIAGLNKPSGVRNKNPLGDLRHDREIVRDVQRSDAV